MGGLPLIGSVSGTVYSYKVLRANTAVDSNYHSDPVGVFAHGCFKSRVISDGGSGDFALENVSFDLRTVLVLEFRVDEGEEVC